MKPQPKILLAKDGFEILEAGNVWSIVYAGAPINIRYRNPDWSRPTYMPRRTEYKHAGYAQAFANKLNKKFGTDLFSVKELECVTDMLYEIGKGDMQ